MSNFEKKRNYQKVEVYSEQVKAGKRTYYFDVKETKKGDRFLTISERSRKYNEDGTFKVEKHKLFLYQEDFVKFANALKNSTPFMGLETSENNNEPLFIEEVPEDVKVEEEIEYYQAPEMLRKNKKKKKVSPEEEINEENFFSDISFEDLYD